MREPIDIPRYVALVSDEPIDQEIVKAWFACVKAKAPAGTILVIPSTDDAGMPRTVCLVHREKGDRHLYMVPLTRDLEESETEIIVEAFVAMLPDSDYEIENSAAYAEMPVETPTINIDQDRYIELCTAWAKRQHDLWLAQRTEQGWRYGSTMSISQKVNPLMLPWEQLPAKYRIPNLDEPQALLDLLNQQGYTVVSKGELETMMGLIRR